jgi:hypothetical protein
LVSTFNRLALVSNSSPHL